MIKTIILAAAVSAVAAWSASAQTAPPAAAVAATTTTASAAVAPQSVEDCLKAAFDLAQKAESGKLTDDKLDQIEGLLVKLEGHCDEKRFADAASVTKDLATIIDGATR